MQKITIKIMIILTTTLPFAQLLQVKVFRIIQTYKIIHCIQSVQIYNLSFQLIYSVTERMQLFFKF